MSAVEFVKNEILDYFRESKADVGHVLHANSFLHQRMTHWNPKQKESLEQGIEALISDNLIAQNNESLALTKNGVDYIYPDGKNSVRADILGFFVASRADAGDVLNPNSFYHQCMSHWNPKQNKAFDLVVAELINEGLVEDKNGSLALTKKGVDYIY